MNRNTIIFGILFLLFGFVLILLGTAARSRFHEDTDEDDSVYGKHWNIMKWVYIAGSFSFAIGILCLIFAQHG